MSVIGSRLGPYDILSPLGAGGFGEVYKARDTRLDRTVAIKILPSADPELKARFEREAKAIAALTHPHICTLYDVGHQDGTDYLVMEYLGGETLAARITRGALGVSELVDVAISLTDALQTAHAAGILHRDIKPANIFLTARGPKVLDFGLAKTAVNPSPTASMTTTIGSSTEPGATVGTVAYMSPEQLRGEHIDTRSDLFSFGLVLYEMATGRPAFSGTTSAVISGEILHQTPVVPRAVRPEVPGRLEQVILKAIEKDRALRYQYASEIRADLQRVKRDSEAERIDTGASAPAATRAPRRILMPLAAAVTIAAVGVGAYYYRHRAPTLTDKDTIILADFINRTGDPVFDETLRQGLAVQLGQSPFLSIVPDDRIRRALQLMGQPPAESLTDDVARDVCVRTGSTAVVGGSIANLGTRYVLGLRAQNCATGDLLDQEQLQAERKEDVLNVLSQLATQFRTRVGESLATVRRHSTPLEESSTASLDALKAYSAAYRAIGAPTTNSATQTGGRD